MPSVIGGETWKKAIFCQPIKYVPFGFAKWAGLFGPIGRSTSSQPTPGNISIADAEGLSPESKIFSMPLVFNDSFAALIASMYHAASPIIHRVLHHCSLPNILISYPNFYAQQATPNATSAPQIVALLESYRPVGFGFMRYVFPLIVLALVSPSTEQRMLATATLQRWGLSGGLNGLCNAWMSF